MKVTGTLTGTSTVVYDGALTTTLPKGIHYQANSSKDAKEIVFLNRLLRITLMEPQNFAGPSQICH